MTSAHVDRRALQQAQAGAWQRTQERWGLLLAGPAALCLLCLILLPSSLVIIFSATDYQLGASTLRFVGLDNYVALFRDPLFWTSITNTFLYVSIVVPGSVVFGLVAAVLIEARGCLKGFYRAAYFLPVTATLVAMATVWEFMLLPKVGLINQLLELLGFQTHAFLSDPSTALFALTAIGIWELVGFNMVLFMAGLTAIPRHLYEAADLDGAGAWEKFRLVTWPMLGPTTMFVVIVTVIRAFRVFDTVAVLTSGGPNQATEVLLYTMFVEAFRYFKIGYASAITVVFLAMTILLLLLQSRLFDKRVHYS